MKSLPRLVLVASVLLLAACGGTTAAPPSTNGGTGGDTTGGTGEGPGVRYTNGRSHYRVDAPGAMKEAADGSASFIGAAERLEITVLTDASAADPRGFGSQDSATLSSRTSFRIVDRLAPVTLGGRAVQKIVFSWTDGVSSVTSKPNDLVSARYYIPKDKGTLAVVTYSIAANRYDPQGADDVVSTFTWL